MKLEIRSNKGLQVRAAEQGSEFVGHLTGYAAVFNSPSLEFSGWEKPWTERIAPGAFKRSLTEMPDVRALYQHDSAAIIARSGETLQLREDEKGLAVDIALVDTQQNRDIFKLVRTGILDSMSFGFTPRSAKWEDGKDSDTRTLLDVDLFEVSVVTWPAYPASSIGTARGMEIGAAELVSLKAERDAQLLRDVRKNQPDYDRERRFRILQLRSR
jgi:HK97 family phage prohead protease